MHSVCVCVVGEGGVVIAVFLSASVLVRAAVGKKTRQ